MNERIRELMIQSDYPAPELALRAQKLAKLIVLECADLIATRDPRTAPAPEIYLLKIFGVEE